MVMKSHTKGTMGQTKFQTLIDYYLGDMRRRVAQMTPSSPTSEPWNVSLTLYHLMQMTRRAVLP